MKKLLIYILLCLLINSCAFFEYYGDGFYILVVNIHEPQESLKNVKEDIECNLLYDWDEELYGEKIVTTFDTLCCLMYNNNNNRMYENFNLPKNSYYTTRIPSYANEEYNILFYSKSNNKYYNNNFESFYLTTKTDSETFAYEETFPLIDNCEEQCAYFLKDFFKFYPENFKEKFVKDNIVYYIYELEKELVLITHVYFIQIIIVDDNKAYPMEVVSCNYMGLNGVVTGIEVSEMKTINERGLIESYNVKPKQTHEDYVCFAEKFVTFGLPNTSSWNNNGEKCELGLCFTFNDNTQKKGKVNIINKFKEKPLGGVITIVLNNSEISKKIEIPDDGLFDVIVEDWNLHEFDIF